MVIAILLYDGMTALDAIGPYEVLAQLPGATVRFVAERPGTVRVDTGALGLVASHGIADLPGADVLVVPGGPGDALVRAKPPMLEWIRAVHATTRWTTSVCNGSLILGAAGLLRGLRATSHWMVLEELRAYGAEPTLERVVEQGRIVTAAGVSSGIDMALRLAQRIAGDDVAQGIQLGIEYDPQPPFDAGSPAKAPPHVVAMVRELFLGLMASRGRAAPAV
jgi:putative intracellular protease/amidase